MENIEAANLEFGQLVRIFSIAGPCLRAAVVKVNRSTIELNHYGRKPMWAVHTAPCVSCTDHVATQYPAGYTN